MMSKTAAPHKNQNERAGRGKTILGLAAAVLLTLLFLCPRAQAATGTIYSCTINPVYEHPVTGKIEDAGGSSAKATGQAMVESCMTSKGMLEATDSGNFYLTVRLGLVDYTKNQSFKVQKRGASGWSSPKIAVTKTGKNGNGTTKDVCIKVPSRNCILRISMYVTSMGRDVVFYAYPSNFKQGKPSGMKATVVTAASTGATAAAGNAEEAETSQGSSSGSGASSTTGDGNETSTDSEETDSSTSSSDSAESDESGVSEAEGLGLSTADEVTSADSSDSSEDSAATDSSTSLEERILAYTISGLIVGIVMLALVSIVVYWFRRNWNKWGGVDPDDYSEAYRKSERNG